MNIELAAQVSLRWGKGDSKGWDMEKRGGLEMCKWVEHLPSIHKTMGSIPNITCLQCQHLGDSRRIRNSRSSLATQCIWVQTSLCGPCLRRKVNIEVLRSSPALLAQPSVPFLTLLGLKSVPLKSSSEAVGACEEQTFHVRQTMLVLSTLHIGINTKTRYILKCPCFARFHKLKWDFLHEHMLHIVGLLQTLMAFALFSAALSTSNS